MIRWMKLMNNKQSRLIIIGLCIGIGLSILQTPFIENNCEKKPTNDHFKSLRGIRSEENYYSEDYEPRIIVDSDFDGNIPKLEEKNAKKLYRPKYYSTELGIKQKLFVAIISSVDTIETFGSALNKTLTPHVDSLIFFIDGVGSKTYDLDIPIVGFKDSRPLLNIFRVISYLKENYLSTYDFFFIVTDHSYIHGRKLVNLVQKLSVSQMVHMGALTDHPESMYCSIDGGLLLSHRILQMVGDQLSWCTRNTYSDFDTDNVGRCILHSTDLACHPMLQGQRYSSYHLREDIDVNSHLELIGSSSVIKEAVTITGITNAEDIYKIHMFYLEEDVRQIKASVDKSRDLVLEAYQHMNKDLSAEWPIGYDLQHIPKNRFDVIPWIAFNSTHFFHANERFNTKQIVGADLYDIKNVIDSAVVYMQKKHLGTLEYRSLNHGHRRVDPTRGVDYKLSLLFRNNTSGKTVAKHVEAFRGLTKPEMVVMPYVTESGSVSVIIPVSSSDLQLAYEFIERFSSSVKTEHVYVTMMLLYTPEDLDSTDTIDVFRELKANMKTFNKEHIEENCKFTPISLATVGRIPSDFALVDLAIKKIPGETLIIFSSLMAHFTTDFINRARMNTILKHQIFSPVPFSFFHPDVIEDHAAFEKGEVNRNIGHFDLYNYKHISFYSSDYVQARESIVEDIPKIIGEKDLKFDNAEEYELDLYEMFVQVSDLHVLRASEPMLKLSYQQLQCPLQNLHSSEFNLKCNMRHWLSFGLRTQLSKIILQN